MCACTYFFMYFPEYKLQHTKKKKKELVRKHVEMITPHVKVTARLRRPIWGGRLSKKNITRQYLQ